MTPPPGGRASRALPLVFPALAIALFPRPFVGAATFFFYDTGLQNLTFRAFWFREFAAGHFATWCPGMFAGYPLFAETQTGPLYPPTFLLFSLLPPTLAFSWSVLLHFAVAGIGAFLLARRLGAGSAGALTTGIAYELSGFLVTHLVHFNLLVGAAWSPWVAYLSLRAADGRPRAALLLGGAFGCLLLGAHPYATLMNGMLAAIVLAGRAGRSARTLAGVALVLAAVVALGAALAAVQLLPARELLARTPRGAAVDWTFLTFGSFPPWNVATLVAPDLFGTPVDATFWGGPDWSHYAETCAYAGVVTLALAAAAVALRRDVATATFTGVAALSFLLMLGEYTPVYRLVAWIPVLRSTRLPARFALLLTLALAVLAGLGLDALRREEDPRRRRRAVAWGAGLLVALAAGAFVLGGSARAPDAELASTGRAWTARLPEIVAAARATTLRMGIVVAAALLALVPFAGRRVPAAATAAPLVVLALDLFAWGRAFNPVTSTDLFARPPPAVEALPDVWPRPRIFRQGLDEIWERGPRLPRTDLVTPGWRGHEASYETAMWSVPPNSQLLWGVDSGEGFTSLPPLAWLEWMGLPAQLGASMRPDLTEAQADLLALDAVLSSGSGIAGEGWEVQALPGDLFLSRNRDPLPRVRLARSWAVWPRPRLLEEIRARDYDPRRRVLLEEPPPGGAAVHDGGRVDEPLPAREVAPGRWDIELPAGAAGVVVVAESWDPGWIAVTPDGARLPVLRADGLFLGVPVAPGVTRIELRFAPRSVQLGAVVSILAGLGLALAAIRARDRKHGLRLETRAGPRHLAAMTVAFALVVTSGSWLLDVGDLRVDYSRSTLEAAAVRSWAQEALAALRQGAPAEAVRLMEAARARQPGDPVLEYRLGLAERAAGRAVAARAAFERALALDPGFDAARAALEDRDGEPGAVPNR